MRRILQHPDGIDIKDVGFLYVLLYRTQGRCWMKVGKTIEPKRRLMEYNLHLPINIFENYFYLSERIYNLSVSERLLIDYVKTLSTCSKAEKGHEWFLISGVQWGTHKINPRAAISTISFINSLTDLYFEGDLS